jgi:hypothetical protein
LTGVSSGATSSRESGSVSTGKYEGAKTFRAVVGGITKSSAVRTCAFDGEIDATNTPAIIASPDLVRFSTLNRFTDASPTVCETFAFAVGWNSQLRPFFLLVSTYHGPVD